MMLPRNFLLPRLYPLGQVKINDKYFPRYSLEWASFGPLEGPKGCVDQSFALSQSSQDRLILLGMTVENLFPKNSSRHRDPLALAGCVAEISDLLADCAIKVARDRNNGALNGFAWLDKSEKLPLRLWISQRIWMMAGPVKNGYGPQELATLSLFPVAKRVPVIKVIKERLDVTDGEFTAFDFSCICVKDDRLIRLHLYQKPGHDCIVKKICEGKISDFVVVFYDKPEFSIRLGALDGNEQLDHHYSSSDLFIEDSILNGIEQKEGMIEFAAHIPSLFKVVGCGWKSAEGVAPVGVTVGTLARELGLPSHKVIEFAAALNIMASNASHVLKPGQVDRIRAKIHGLNNINMNF